MGSKFLGSNIAWMSRYELIHKTLELYYVEIKDKITLDVTLRANLEEALKLKATKCYLHIQAKK
jgi:citrate lyase gamma subunit